jgi:hypothetical protein
MGLKHTLYETSDADRPKEICDRNGEVVLGLCKVCGAAESELDRPCDPLSRERALFEKAMFEHYLRQRALGVLDPNDEGDGTPEALFWKQPNGDYGVLMFNAAWYGWRAAKGLV